MDDGSMDDGGARRAIRPDRDAGPVRPPVLASGPAAGAGPGSRRLVAGWSRLHESIMDVAFPQRHPPQGGEPTK